MGLCTKQGADDRSQSKKLLPSKHKKSHLVCIHYCCSPCRLVWKNTKSFDRRVSYIIVVVVCRPTSLAQDLMWKLHICHIFAHLPLLYICFKCKVILRYTLSNSQYFNIFLMICCPGRLHTHVDFVLHIQYNLCFTVTAL